MERDALYEFLRDELSVDTSEIEDSTLLFSSGLIDSFALVELITFIESHCGIHVNTMDVTLENLDSIELILRYVERAAA